MTNRISLICACLLSLAVANSFSQDVQTWSIDILDQNEAVHATASMECNRTACEAKSWTVLPQGTGCLYQLDFQCNFPVLRSV